MAEKFTITVTDAVAAQVRQLASRAGSEPEGWLAGMVAAALPSEKSSGPSTIPATERVEEWLRVADPHGAFTVEVPRGWTGEASSVVTPAMRHSLVTITSPDGASRLFTGDAELPVFLEPGRTMFPGPGQVVRPPVGAAELLTEWVQRRYGGRRGFQILGTAAAPDLASAIADAATRGGVSPSWCDTASLQAKVGERTLLLLGGCVGIGWLWFPQVHGILTVAEAEPLRPVLLRMLISVRATAAEQQRLAAERAAGAAQHHTTMNQLHQNSMLMTQQHHQNMANIQASGMAHQARMGDLWDTHAAQQQGWVEQQSSQDASHHQTMAGLRVDPAGARDSHRDSINAIREEHTVWDAHGDAHQVAAGYDTYYYRRHDNSWIGLQAHEQLSDIPGINPDDYEQTRFSS